MTVMYMQIEGIGGDVTTNNYDGWIELHGAEFSTKRQISQVVGNITDREGSRPSLSEMTFKKRLDKASPLLLIESLTGTAKSTVKIHMLTTSKDPKPFMEYTLYDAIISGNQIQAMASHNITDESNKPKESLRPSESFAISFSKIESSFTPFDKSHNALAPITSGFDLIEGVKV